MSTKHISKRTTALAALEKAAAAKPAERYVLRLYIAGLTPRSTLAIQNNVVPPTANLHVPDPECDLDYVPLTARDWPTDTVLTVGSGFGGFQSAMVLRRAA